MIVYYWYSRWIYPLSGLWDGIFWKVLVALPLGILNILEQLVVPNQLLAAGIALLIVIDFITGIAAAKRRGEPIQSSAFRQTLIKTADYIIILLAFTILSKMFPFMAWTETIAYLFVALTEIKSIIENWTEKKSDAYKVWMMMRREITRRGDIIFDPEATEEEGYLDPKLNNGIRHHDHLVGSASRSPELFFGDDDEQHR